MAGWYFEDYEPGTTIRTTGRTVTETDVMNFLGIAGMHEPLFLDQEYVREHTPYSGRLVPGALTYAMAEGLVVQTGVLHERGLAFLGLDELRIPRPVYVGDTIRVLVEIVETRPTRRPDRGVIMAKHEVRNQHDVEVMTFTITRMVLRRPAESAG